MKRLTYFSQPLAASFFYWWCCSNFILLVPSKTPCIFRSSHSHCIVLRLVGGPPIISCHVIRVTKGSGSGAVTVATGTAALPCIMLSWYHLESRSYFVIVNGRKEPLLSEGGAKILWSRGWASAAASKAWLKGNSQEFGAVFLFGWWSVVVFVWLIFSTSCHGIAASLPVPGTYQVPVNYRHLVCMGYVHWYQGTRYPGTRVWYLVRGSILDGPKYDVVHWIPVIRHKLPGTGSLHMHQRRVYLVGSTRLPGTPGTPGTEKTA